MNTEMNTELKDHIDNATKLVHECAVNNGWWSDRDQIVRACCGLTHALGLAADANVQIALLGLICQEAGEAMEFVRTGDGPDDKLCEYHGVDVELVDIIIRAMDLLGKRGAPAGEIFLAKLKKNVERGYKHGGKLA